jgi:hypothetical protein
VEKYGTARQANLFLISNFRRVVNAVCFLLGNSPAYEFYMPTFRNTLSVPSSYAGRFHLHTDLPMKIEQTVCSETSAYKFQTPGNYPEENTQQGQFIPAKVTERNRMEDPGTDGEKSIKRVLQIRRDVAKWIHPEPGQNAASGFCHVM